MSLATGSQHRRPKPRPRLRTRPLVKASLIAAALAATASLGCRAPERPHRGPPAGPGGGTLAPQTHTLAMRSSDGRFLITSDGSVWRVAAPSRPAAARWRNGDRLAVRRAITPAPDHPFAIANQTRGGRVPAKLGRHLD